MNEIKFVNYHLNPTQKEHDKCLQFKAYHTDLLKNKNAKFEYIFSESNGIGRSMWIKEVTSGDICDVTDLDAW